LRAGALGVAMSGSGSAVYGVFGSEAVAQAAASRLPAPFVAVCVPVGRGVELLRGPCPASRRLF
jgi:4-diphosphocytidyl-2C-methyl-D-erythritol kinase